MTKDKPVILVVDDAPTGVMALAVLLQDEYQVKVAASGERAVEIAKRAPQPDLILLDVVMPGMDGREVCRRLKSDASTMKIPIIFVTTQSSELDEEKGLQLGAVDYIIKPFSAPIVKARIYNHVKLKHQADLLESLSLIDALTQVANRRQFDERLETEWKRAARDNYALSILMLDIDHFKEYNDHYGHGAGDRCLQSVAQALQSGMARPADLMARIGGEEFAALLPQTGHQSAMQIAEKLRQNVALLQIPHACSSVEPFVTISIGCATASPGEDAGEAGSLLERADSKLYVAKKAGRNRVGG